MRWLLAGYCGLTLINISVAIYNTPVIIQKPRFYGVRPEKSVGIYCQYKQQEAASVQWYKAFTYNDTKEEIKAGQRIKFQPMGLIKDAILSITDLHIEDNGVYFCKIDKTWGPGTALQVARRILLPNAQHRTNMKDGLIIFQGLLLAVCVAAILLRKQNLSEKRDSIYEEPETDHIYEGLTIETCGGGLYEELSVYAQAEGAEAPWE